MGGIIFSWLGAILAGVAVLVIVVGSLILAARMTRVQTARLRCPWVHREVVVQYATDGGHPIAVLTCSAFADPRALTCGAPCVAGRNGSGAPNAVGDLLRG